MPEHDVERFERIILPHLDDAYTLARYLVRDSHAAQDVVQDAALRALRYFDGFRGGDARAWLLSIVRNVSLTWRQRTAGDAHTVDIADIGVAGGHETDAAAIESSERERIVGAIESLPEEFREIIVLREIEELSYKEISTVVGVPVGTVMSRLARGRKRLAACSASVSRRRADMRCDTCRELLNARIDNELPAAEVADVDQHLASCATCTAEYRLIAQTHRTLSEAHLRYTAPDLLKARIRGAIAQERHEEPSVRRTRPWWRFAAAGIVIAAMSSALTFAVTRPSGTPVANDLVASHVRSLQPGHLTDIVSTNQHNVKPWFNVAWTCRRR
jgi:RNA polymerase sigma-70 factor (ECF subfamily)